MLLSLLPLLDRDTAAAITLPLELQLRSLRRREAGEQPSRRRPRFAPQAEPDTLRCPASVADREGELWEHIATPGTRHANT